MNEQKKSIDEFCAMCLEIARVVVETAPHCEFAIAFSALLTECRKLKGTDSTPQADPLGTL